MWFVFVSGQFGKPVALQTKIRCLAKTADPEKNTKNTFSSKDLKTIHAKPGRQTFIHCGTFWLQGLSDSTSARPSCVSHERGPLVRTICPPQQRFLAHWLFGCLPAGLVCHVTCYGVMAQANCYFGIFWRWNATAYKCGRTSRTHIDRQQNMFVSSLFHNERTCCHVVLSNTHIDSEAKCQWLGILKCRRVRSQELIEDDVGAPDVRSRHLTWLSDFLSGE